MSEDRSYIGTQLRRSALLRVAFLPRLVIWIAILLCISTTARADGIDVIPFMFRVGGVHPAIAVAIVIGAMLVNYLLNVVVIGLPAARAAQTGSWRFARDLIGFTLLAQIADRIGAFVALMLGFLIVSVLGIPGEAGIAKGALFSIVLNFVFSGLAIGFLAMWYLSRRWGILQRPARVIAIAAAVITNPVWLAVYLWAPAVI
jgi:hypothetical protein